MQDTGSTLATYKRLFIHNPFSSDEENEAKKSAQQQEEDAESARRQRNYEKLQGFHDRRVGQPCRNCYGTFDTCSRIGV